MSKTGETASGPRNLREWLSDPRPSSRAQARTIQFCLGWRRFRQNPLTMAGLFIVLTLGIAAAFSPWLITHDPTAAAPEARLLPPGANGHWLGTDDLGRDIYSRLVAGAGVTLYIVALVAVTAP